MPIFDATWPAVPEADSTDDIQSRDVVGRKTDAAATGAVSATESIMAYAKQLVTEGIARDAVLNTTGVVALSRSQTYDRLAGVNAVLEVSVTSALNAGLVTLATITDQPCLIKSIVIHADTAAHADMTTCAVKGGASQVVTFIGTGDATEANLNAIDKQVSWTGAVRLAATKTIVIDLQGVGATAADLTVTIEYEACVDGGYLA